MSRGKIKAVLGEGLYSVELLPEQERYLKKKEALEAQLADATAKEAEQAAETEQAKTDLNNSLTDVDFAITAYNSDSSDANKAAVETNTELRNIKANAARRAEAAWQSTRLIIESVNKTLDNIAPPTGEVVDAWCADYNTALELETEVGLIDIGREKGKIVPTALIMPAGQDGTEAAFDGARDGEQQQYKHADPNAVYYNSALLGGFNKWKPRYRKGTIVSVDTQEDTAVVDIDALASTSTRKSNGEPLSVNQTDQVTADVVYMSCAAAAFAAGDRVVVAFLNQDWSSPQVIGFESNPVACIANLSILYEYNRFGAKSNSRTHNKVVDSRYFDQKSDIEYFWYAAGGADLPVAGQYHDGEIYTSRPYFSTFDPDQAIIVNAYTNWFAYIQERSASVPFPNGAQTVACTTSDKVIVFARWKGADPDTSIYYGEIHFFNYDGSVIKVLPYTAAGAEGRAVADAKANESGLIVYEGYPPAPLASWDYYIRIIDFDGAQLFSKLVSLVGLAHDVYATDSYFIHMTYDREYSAEKVITVFTYDLTGALIATMEIPFATPPEDRPEGFEGQPLPITQNVYMTAQDDVLTVVHSWHWYDGSQIAGRRNVSMVQIVQYTMIDGAALFFKAQSDIVTHWSMSRIWDVNMVL